MRENLLFRLCLILTVAFTVYSCRTDHLPEKETTYNNSNAFQFVELKDIPQVSKFVKNRSGRNDLKLSLINYAAKSSINQNDINLESSDILKYTTADGVYYIFNINEIGDDNTIYTLEAKENNGSIVSAKIIEYASDANLQDNPLDLARFNGRVSAYSLDGEKYSSVNYTEGNSNCPPVSGGGYPENPSYPNPTNPPGGTEPSFPWTPNYPGVPTPPSSPSPGGSNGSSGSGSPGGNTGLCDPNTYVVIESFTYENGDVFEVLENDCGVRYTRTRPLLNSSFENKNTTADCDDNGSGVIVLPNPKHTPCAKIKAQVADIKYNGKITYLEGKVYEKKEFGFRVGNHTDAGYQEVFPTNKSSQIDFNILNDTFGYMHTHYEGLIPIFSPGDINTFIKLLKNAHNNGIPLNMVFMTLVNPDGTIYQLRGDNIDIASLSVYPTSTIENIVNNLYMKDYKMANSNQTQEYYQTQFLKFMREVMPIPGAKLYSVDGDGKAKEIYLQGNNRKTSDCSK